MAETSGWFYTAALHFQWPVCFANYGYTYIYNSAAPYNDKFPTDYRYYARNAIL